MCYGRALAARPWERATRAACGSAAVALAPIRSLCLCGEPRRFLRARRGASAASPWAAPRRMSVSAGCRAVRYPQHEQAPHRALRWRILLRCAAAVAGARLRPPRRARSGQGQSAGTGAGQRAAGVYRVRRVQQQGLQRPVLFAADSPLCSLAAQILQQHAQRKLAVQDGSRNSLAADCKLRTCIRRARAHRRERSILRPRYLFGSLTWWFPLPRAAALQASAAGSRCAAASCRPTCRYSTWSSSRRASRWGTAEEVGVERRGARAGAGAEAGLGRAVRWKRTEGAPGVLAVV